MPEKYTMEQIKKMGLYEHSRLIGYDIRDLNFGVTTEDIYQIANGYKTFEDIFGFSVDSRPGDFTEEELREIDNRKLSEASLLFKIGCIILLLVGLGALVYLAIYLTNIAIYLTNSGNPILQCFLGLIVFFGILLIILKLLIRPGNLIWNCFVGLIVVIGIIIVFFRILILLSL